MSLHFKNLDSVKSAESAISNALATRGFKQFINKELSVDVTRFVAQYDSRGNPRKDVEMFLRLQAKPDASGKFSIARWSESEQAHIAMRLESAEILDTDSYIVRVDIDQYAENIGKIFGQARKSISRGTLPKFYYALDYARETELLWTWNTVNERYEEYKLPDNSPLTLTRDALATLCGAHLDAVIHEFLASGDKNPYARPDTSKLRKDMLTNGKSKPEIDSEIDFKLQGWKNKRNAKSNPRNHIYAAWKNRNAIAEAQHDGTALQRDGSLKAE